MVSGALGTIGGAMLQNPALLGQAAAFAPKAPRTAAQLALRLAGVAGDDAAALQENGLPGWSYALVGVAVGVAVGLYAGKRYPSLARLL